MSDGKDGEFMHANGGGGRGEYHSEGFFFNQEFSLPVFFS